MLARSGVTYWNTLITMKQEYYLNSRLSVHILSKTPTQYPF